LSSAPRTAVACRLADGDIRLKTLNVCELQLRNDPCPDQRLNMLFNSAPEAVERKLQATKA
jgi:hypothetical protein